ncbi:MAG: M56 family metallopeptidase [Dehalococcoidia bacterium]|nr:M56 family metallopeptidase [Dehalococcoidia bacterium]
MFDEPRFALPVRNLTMHPALTDLYRYLAQSISYSVIAAIAVFLLVKGWKSEDPRLRLRFYFLVLALPVVLPLLFNLSYPQRNALFFRDHLALLDTGRWLDIVLWKQVTLGHAALAIPGLTAALFLTQEAIPLIRRYTSRKRSLEPIMDGQFPVLDSALCEASRIMGIKAPPVALAPSEEHVMYVSGLTKPVLAISPGLLTSITPEELRAMMCHEMAHLSRRDHWTSWMLVVVRSLAFFNPVAWFISRLMWQENEKACDDMAVSATGDPASLASALVKAVAMTKAATGPIVPPIGRTSGQEESLKTQTREASLANRVRRLVSGEGHRLDKWDSAKLWTTALLLATILFFVV